MTAYLSFWICMSSLLYKFETNSPERQEIVGGGGDGGGDGWAVELINATVFALMYKNSRFLLY